MTVTLRNTLLSVYPLKSSPKARRERSLDIYEALTYRAPTPKIPHKASFWARRSGILLTIGIGRTRSMMSMST